MSDDAARAEPAIEPQPWDAAWERAKADPNGIGYADRALANRDYWVFADGQRRGYAAGREAGATQTLARVVAFCTEHPTWLAEEVMLAIEHGDV